MRTLTEALLAAAARRWPAEERDQAHRAWLADLHELTGDPAGGRWVTAWRGLRFAASLAVRRPPQSAAPVVRTARPGTQLFGATIAVAIAGPLIALLLVHLPALVADRLPAPDATDAAHRLPLPALAPILVILGVLAGRRLARRDAPRGVDRVVATILVGWCCARLLPVFGGVLVALPGLAVWAAGLWAAARVAARRPRGILPWAWLGVAMLVLTDLATTVTVWLDLGGAPPAQVWAWFPGALLDPAVRLPIGPGVLDAAELLPHGLIVVGAFTLAYVSAASQPGVSRSRSWARAVMPSLGKLR